MSAKCNDIDVVPSLSLSESSGTKFGHSFTKWSYSLHLQASNPDPSIHTRFSILILELDGDLTLLSLSLDLDCLHVLLFSQFLPVLLLNLPQKLPLQKLPLPPSISSITFNMVSAKRSISSPIIILV